MCGIIGLMSDTPVNQRVYDALHLLQHRGQDAAGIATLDGLQFHFFKGLGLVRDVFRTRNMRDLTGSIGIGHVRYPTQGNATSPDECQPFYVNAPFGIAFAHNGNLTNADDLRRELYDTDRRHLNTTSDSEVLLNVLASELSRATSEGRRLTKTAVFDAVRALHRRVRGSYACVAVIAGKGMLAFRDPCGIRPICWGSNKLENGFTEYMVSSESVTMIGLGFSVTLSRARPCGSTSRATSRSRSAPTSPRFIPAPSSSSTSPVPTPRSTASTSTPPACVWARSSPTT